MPGHLGPRRAVSALQRASRAVLLIRVPSPVIFAKSHGCVCFYGAATLHGGAQCVPCVSNGPVTASGPLESPELLRSRPLQRAHPHDPGLSRPVPCWRSPDRWTCARSSSTARGPVLEHLRSAPCPGLYNRVYPPRRAIQCTFASLGCSGVWHPRWGVFQSNSSAFCAVQWLSPLALSPL